MDVLIFVVFGGMHCNHNFFLKVQVINDKFGIVEGLMTTVHSTTGTHLQMYNILVFCLHSAGYVIGLQDKSVTHNKMSSL
jgi:hypothetical protein